MDQKEQTARAELREFVEATTTEFGIPGVAVGVWTDGREHYVCHGVTSVLNPLSVDVDTLFLIGSVTKTYTATALMRLVANAHIDLNAPVQRYVPELRLTDERSTAAITVLNLLNHTAGLDWGITFDTGEGDDALARYIARLENLGVVAAPGERPSYSQAGYNLAGRIIEKTTGVTYERAVTSLVLEPLGLSNSFFARDDIMTRRFVVGHNRGQDGALHIARLWRRWRGDNPGGGLASSVTDQLRWARFHLGDGVAENGVRLLPTQLLDQMKRPTVALRGSNLGDAIGIGWFLQEIDGVRAVGHGGSANGQFAELMLVPERRFAVVALSNAGPEGISFNQAVVRWALHSYVGITVRDPTALPFDEGRAREIAGRYENKVMTLTIEAHGASLRLEVRMKPEIRAAADKELPPDHAPFDFGLLHGDDYIITSGAFRGQRGFFTRNEHGVVVGVDLAGRLFSRVAADVTEA